MDEHTSGPAVAERKETAAAAPQKKRRKKKKTVRIIVTVSIILVVAAGITFGLYKLFHKTEEVKSNLTDMVTRGSITSMVEGSGVTKAKEAETITLTSGGTVLEVFVKDGDQVTEGDPLYTIDSTEALAAVDDKQRTVTNYQKQMDALNEAVNYLNVTADFAGTLMNTTDIKVGDTVAAGTKIATLVDDSRLKLTLYFSYAYQNAISPSARRRRSSVPSTMSQLSGTVTEVDYVKRITPEGSNALHGRRHGGQSRRAHGRHGRHGDARGRGSGTDFPL